MRRELSSCAIQKFNGYELLRNHLQQRETKDFKPIDIVYKSNLDVNNSIFCFYDPNIILGFHASVEKMQKEKKKWIIQVRDSVTTVIIILLKTKKK